MKTFILNDTKLEELKRVVDREGDWQRYFHVPSNRYLDGVTTILSLGYVKGKGFEKWLSDTPEEERSAIFSESQDRGDIVHRAIDMLIGSEKTISLTRQTEIFSKEAGEEKYLSNRTWDNMLAFHRFWDLHRPIVIASELPVYNLEYGFAGTADVVLILTKACAVKSCPCDDLIGKPGVFDWKTSKKVYPDKMSQSAAYAKSDNLPVVPLYAAVLALGSKAVLTGGYELKVAQGDALASAWRKFLAAQEIADIQPFNPTKEIKEIPDILTITITKELSEVEIVPEN